jgi:hypothetical protein
MRIDENQLLRRQTITNNFVKVDSEDPEQVRIVSYHVIGLHQKLMVGQPLLSPGLTTYGLPDKECSADRNYNGRNARDVSNFHRLHQKDPNLISHFVRAADEINER